MSNVKNTKKVTTFLRFFVLLPYLTNFLCCISLLEGYFSLRSTLYFFYFCFGLMFCSEIHEHREEHQKGNNFSTIFILLPYLTPFLCHIDILLSYLLFCCISVLDQCFALRFMSTMKNTEKVTTFCVALMFWSQNHEHREEHQKDNFYAIFRSSTIFN